MSDAEFKVDIQDASLWKKQFPSDTVMTAQEMIDFNLEHSRKFMEGDFDGIMEHSINDDAVWEFFPNRIRISGYAALKLYHEITYNVVISQIDPRNGEDTREYYSTTTSANTLTHEFSSVYVRSDGSTFRGYTIAVIPFANGKMCGERIYLDREMAEWFEDGLGEAFFSMAGVERF